MAARGCRPTKFFYEFLVVQDKITMAASSYQPKDDSGKADLLDNVAATLPKYAQCLTSARRSWPPCKPMLSLSATRSTCLALAQSYAHNTTASKNQLRDGGTDASLWPIPPLLPEPIPPIVKSGIIPRFSLFVGRLKAHKPSMGDISKQSDQCSNLFSLLQFLSSDYHQQISTSCHGAK
jgi:hypothetical protein